MMLVFRRIVLVRLSAAVRLRDGTVPKANTLDALARQGGVLQVAGNQRLPRTLGPGTALE
jgi:hypothetical protein